MRKAHTRTYVRRSSCIRVFLTLLALTITVVFFIAGSIRTKAVSPEAAASENGQIRYMSYEVQPGDTLWDLAAEFNDFSLQDSSSYIDEVRAINHILGDDIHAGCYLVLPYYGDRTGDLKQ